MKASARNQCKNCLFWTASHQPQAVVMPTCPGEPCPCVLTASLHQEHWNCAIHRSHGLFHQKTSWGSGSGLFFW